MTGTGKILLRSAWETYKADGIKVLSEQTLRYLVLYGSPWKAVRYWWLRAFGFPRQCVKVQGSWMDLDLRDKGIHADLFLNGIREPHATRHLQGILKPNWVVVDIGANIGYYTLMEAARTKRVYALEPSPDNFRNLLVNISLNGYRNIKPHSLAIGDREGTVGFELSKACNWSKVAKSGPGDIRVKMTTLDKFLDGRRVDFIRMDVEGYEMSILNGMCQTLQASRPDMFIEVHRDLLRDYGSSQLEFMQHLAGYGYRLSKSFISARPGPEGRLVDLLANPLSRRAITERGIASHMFFSIREEAERET